MGLVLCLGALTRLIAGSGRNVPSRDPRRSRGRGGTAIGKQTGTTAIEAAERRSAAYEQQPSQQRLHQDHHSPRTEQPRDEASDARPGAGSAGGALDSWRSWPRAPGLPRALSDFNQVNDTHKLFLLPLLSEGYGNDNNTVVIYRSLIVTSGR